MNDHFYFFTWNCEIQQIRKKHEVGSQDVRRPSNLAFFFFPFIPTSTWKGTCERVVTKNYFSDTLLCAMCPRTKHPIANFKNQDFHCIFDRGHLIFRVYRRNKIPQQYQHQWYLLSSGPTRWPLEKKTEKLSLKYPRCHRQREFYRPLYRGPF